MCVDVFLPPVLLVATLLATPSAFAADFTWTGLGDGESWTDSENWRPNTRYPGSDPEDGAVIEETSTSLGIVELDDQVELRYLSVGIGRNVRVSGSGWITVTSHGFWTNGLIETGLEVAPGAVMSIIGKDPKSLSRLASDLPRVRLRNRGTLIIGGSGELGLHGGAMVENAGTLTLMGGTSVRSWSCCTEPVAGIRGTGRLTVLPDPLAVLGGAHDATLHNMTFVAPPLIEFTSGAGIGLEGGLHSLPDGVRIAGDGRLTLLRARVDAAGIGIGASALLEVGQGTTLAGDLRLAGDGQTIWSGGTVSGQLSVMAGHRLRLEGRETLTFAQQAAGRRARLVNLGTIEFARGRLELRGTNNGGPYFENEGDLLLATGVEVAAATCCGNPSMVKNRGRMVATGGPDAITLRGTFLENAGEIEVRAVRLGFVGGGSFTQVGIGVTSLVAGSAIAAPEVLLRGGRLTGTGSIEGVLRNKAGTVAPGAPGQVGTVLARNYVQGHLARLELDVAGLDRADRLVVSDVAHLRGIRTVALLDGYQPLFGQEIEVMTYGGRQGVFTAVEGLDLAPDRFLHAVYSEPGGHGSLRLRLQTFGRPLACRARTPQEGGPVDWDRDRREMVELLANSPFALGKARAIERRFAVVRRPLPPSDDIGLTGRAPDGRVAFQFAWSSIVGVFGLASAFIHEVEHGLSVLEAGFTVTEAAPFLSSRDFVTLRWHGEQAAYLTQESALREIVDVVPDLERCWADLLARDNILAILAREQESLEEADAVLTALRQAIVGHHEEQDLLATWQAERAASGRDVSAEVGRLLRSPSWPGIVSTWSPYRLLP